LFTVSRFLNFKSATDLISIENSLSAEIGQVTDFRGLKSDWWLISVMEIRSQNGPLVVFNKVVHFSRLAAHSQILDLDEFG
jgi:hypothetical protein